MARLPEHIYQRGTVQKQVEVTPSLATVSFEFQCDNKIETVTETFNKLILAGLAVVEKERANNA